MFGSIIAYTLATKKCLAKQLRPTHNTDWPGYSPGRSQE